MAVFAPKPRGLADLVSYAALVDEGVCLLKDGGFLAAWSYTGPDLESASHDELAVLSSQMNAALVRLGNGWMLNVDAIRRPSVGYPDGGAFPDPTTRLIDDERRERYTAEGTHFESAYYLALTYRTPAEIENRVSAFFLEGDGEQRRGWDQILEIFSKTVTDIEDALSSRLTLVRLDSAELLTYLHRCISGLRHQVRVPAIPMYLDALLASQDLVGGFRPRIGDRHVRVIAIMGFPMDSVPEILGFLNRLPVEYRWSTRFIFLDPASAERALRVYRRNWFQKRHGLVGLLKESFNFGTVTFANKDGSRPRFPIRTTLLTTSALLSRCGPSRYNRTASRVDQAPTSTGDNGAAASHPTRPAERTERIKSLSGAPLSPRTGGGDREPDPDCAQRHR